MRNEIVSSFYSSWALLTTIAIAVLAAMMLWGHGFLRLFHVLRISHDGIPLRCEEILYGSFGFSVIGFVGVLLGFRLPLTFAVGTALAGLTWVILRRRGFGTPAARAVELRADRWAQWAAALVAVVGSLIWSINNFRGLESIGETVVLVPWVDFFFHARPIASFGHFFRDFGTLHWSMYGLPVPTYHYASYMLSALIAGLSDIPSIQLATSFYPVAGMLLTGASMIVLANASGGPRVALLAVLLLFFLPDLSNFVRGGTRQSSYFFFQQVGVGGAYAVAVLGLALACVLKAARDGSLILAAWALLLLVISALFKAQIFLAYGMFFAVSTIYIVLLAKSPRLAIGLMLTIVALYALASSRMGAIPNAPTLTLSLSGMRNYVQHVLGPTHVSGVTAIAMIPLAAADVLVSTYGPLLIFLVVPAWRLRRNPQVRGTLGIALLIFAAHICVRLLIDDNRGFGDPAEINRKTFVWPYFVIVYATATMLGHFATTLRAAPSAVSRVNWPAVGGLVVGLMFAICVVAASRLQKWRGVSETFSGVDVPLGLLESARYLRASAAQGDVVQLCKNDRYNELASLADRPVYVAKLMVNGTPVTKDERERFASVELISFQLQTAAAARATAQKLRIGWFVLGPDCRPAWEGESPASFASHGYRVFDMRH